MNGIPLDKPLSVKDIAVMMGIAPVTARRMLLRLEAQHPGVLTVHRDGKRVQYRTTLRSLRRAWPRFGAKNDDSAIENLSERVRILELKVKRLPRCRCAPTEARHE